MRQNPSVCFSQYSCAGQQWGLYLVSNHCVIGIILMQVFVFGACISHLVSEITIYIVPVNHHIGLGILILLLVLLFYLFEFLCCYCKLTMNIYLYIELFFNLAFFFYRIDLFFCNIDTCINYYKSSRISSSGLRKPRAFLHQN